MKNKKRIILANSILSLIVGGTLYYLFSSEVLFVRIIDEAVLMIMGKEPYHILLPKNNLFMAFIRFYLLDMIWGYALVFALFYVLGDKAVMLKRCFITAVIFSAVMELLQLTPLCIGTYDIADIFFEIISEVIAVFIIKTLMRRQHNEKESKITGRNNVFVIIWIDGIRKRFNKWRG